MPLVPSAASQDIHPRSFSGWPLSIAVELDAACPSFLSFVVCAAALKRHAIFSALAALTRGCPETLAARLRLPRARRRSDRSDLLEQIARALTAARAREIVQAVFGRRSGRLPRRSSVESATSRSVNPTCTSPCSRSSRTRSTGMRRNVLRQRSGSIIVTHIEVISRLDPILVHQNVLNRLYGASQADDANAALALSGRRSHLQPMRQFASRSKTWEKDRSGSAVYPVA